MASAVVQQEWNQALWKSYVANREPKLREQRHAADFPAALFPSRRKDPA